jgi:ferredoxin
MNRRSFIAGIVSGAVSGAFILGVGGCTSLGNQNAPLYVEPSLCVGCGLCFRVCPADAVLLIDNKAIIDHEKCMKCGKCVSVCPYDAIS